MMLNRMLENGAIANFEGMDVFLFDESGKIRELTIIYDTCNIRDTSESRD